MEKKVFRHLLSCGLVLGFMTEAGTGNIRFPDHVSGPFPESSEQISRLKVRFSKGRELLKTVYGSVSRGLKALQETSLCRGFRGKSQDAAGKPPSPLKAVDPHSDLLSKPSQGALSSFCSLFSSGSKDVRNFERDVRVDYKQEASPATFFSVLFFCEKMS